MDGLGKSVELEWNDLYSIRTQRLTITPCDKTAAKVLGLLVHDPKVYFPFYVNRPDIDERSNHVDEWVQDLSDWKIRSRFNLVSRLHSTGTVVGGIRFTGNFLSYFVHPALWRQGYGSEMVANTCRRIPGLLGIRMVETIVIRENIGSRRILEKIGFKFCGLGKRSWSENVGYVTVLHYQLLNFEDHHL